MTELEQLAVVGGFLGVVGLIFLAIVVEVNEWYPTIRMPLVDPSVAGRPLAVNVAAALVWLVLVLPVAVLMFVPAVVARMAQPTRRSLESDA